MTPPQESPKAKGAFTAEERAAMKEAAAESRRAKAQKGEQADADACAEKIAAMAPADRALAQKFHDIVTSEAPDLYVKTWYGMPAYAKDGKVVCFFQDAGKFKYRYSTIGFQEDAHLDDGTFWASSFAVTAIGAAEEKKIRALVKKAVS